jgi:rhamnogalacturonan endolyase
MSVRPRLSASQCGSRCSRLSFERLEERVQLSVSSLYPLEYDAAEITNAATLADSIALDVRYFGQTSELGQSAGDEMPPARQMEHLNRGLVALRTSTTTAYVGWRLLATDPADISFNLYRSSNGGQPIKLNATPLTQTTDFVDSAATGFNPGVENSYFVQPVVNLVELAASEVFALPSNAPVRQYLNIPLERPPGGTAPGGQTYTYSANDASVGDVDGDGQYEIILKWEPSNAQDNSNDGYTGNVLIDAYKLNGERLWRIALGRNIRAGAHYTQFMVYDLDGDGKAEVAMRTAPGTVDGAGNNVILGRDNPNADFRNSSGYILTGPEYLTVFNGETGAALATIPFEPARGSVSQWGDNYGNRVDRFLAAIAYLDGMRPSLIMARGYYGPQSASGQARNEIVAYNFRDGELTQLWHFRAGYNINANINREYIGQGNHNLSVADVDGDGRDEIIYGAAAIDDNGFGLYSTGLGHGDALHVSDMLTSRPGLEVFQPHESPSSYGIAGGEFRDARTGELIFSIPATNDVGRGAAFDIDPNYAGYEMWATTSDPQGNPRMIYNASGRAIYPTPGNMFYNFGVWWDDDPLRELLDGTTISDWNYVTRGRQNLVSSTTGSAGSFNNTSGLSSNNGSKSTPALSADILGDWREEVIWRRSDNTALQIWTTAIPATSRIYTLMHDPKYRLDVAWQNVAYNQPPHPGFFLGAGMSEPPIPRIYTVRATDVVGDYSRNGTVDAADFVVWRKAFGQLGSSLAADGNMNGRVDDADYGVWRADFGRRSAAAGLPNSVSADDVWASAFAAGGSSRDRAVFPTSSRMETASTSVQSDGIAARSAEFAALEFEARPDWRPKAQGPIRQINIADARSDALLQLAIDGAERSMDQGVPLGADRRSDASHVNDTKLLSHSDEPIALALAEWR